MWVMQSARRAIAASLIAQRPLYTWIVSPRNPMCFNVGRFKHLKSSLIRVILQLFNHSSRSHPYFLFCDIHVSVWRPEAVVVKWDHTKELYNLITLIIVFPVYQIIPYVLNLRHYYYINWPMSKQLSIVNIQKYIRSSIRPQLSTK